MRTLRSRSVPSRSVRPICRRGFHDEFSPEKLLERPIPLKTAASPTLLREVQFSTAVAGFGQLLRGGSHTGALSYEDIVGQAQTATGEDRFGYRAEFVRLVRAADRLAK